MERDVPMLTEGDGDRVKEMEIGQVGYRVTETKRGRRGRDRVKDGNTQQEGDGVIQRKRGRQRESQERN